MRRTSPTPTRLRAQRGTTAIEFAIIAPVLAAVVVAVIEIGFAVHAGIQTREAASAGALYAAQHGWDEAGITQAVTTATHQQNLTASPAPVAYCGCPGAGGIAQVDCSVSCPDGIAARHYVEVHATAPRTSILPSDLGLPDTLTASSTVRVP